MFRYLMACLHYKEPIVCICYFNMTFSILLELVISGIPFPLCHVVQILQFPVLVVIWVSDSIVWLSLEGECDKQ